MSDSEKSSVVHPAPSRPSLPTSTAAFALPSCSSPAPALYNEEGHISLRFRRPSLLAPKASSYLSHSPLAAVHTPLWRRRRRRGSSSGGFGVGDEGESDRERMFTDSSPSSGSENPTPPLVAAATPQGDPSDVDGSSFSQQKELAAPPPHLTRRRANGHGAESGGTVSKLLSRRFSLPQLRPPRITTLLAESRPEEADVRSEAAFQRLLSACADLPSPTRASRGAVFDRGRFPEEAGHDDAEREASPSDDDDDDEGVLGDVDDAFAGASSSTHESSVIKPITPAQSSAGDDFAVPESPSFPMDVDMPSYSPISGPSSGHWRYTPPPSSGGAMRTSKRKFDDRFDPYASSSKRRAVSPSLAHLRDSHPYSHSYPCILPPPPPSSFTGPPSRSSSSSSMRQPVTLPISIPIPHSASSSVASSPVIGPASVLASSSAAAGGRATVAVAALYAGTASCSSPVLRGLASPVLRPLAAGQRRRLDGEDREIEGAGEGVGGLTLGI